MNKSKRRSSVPLREKGNTVFSTRFSLPSFVKRVNKLTNSQRQAINSTGFGNLLLIPNQMLCKSLLVELMKRWNPKKRAFTMPPGDITISPLDVALILGIHVIGKPVSVREDAPFSNLEKDYGVVLWNRKIAVGALEEKLECLGQADSEDFTRTFLLYMFGTLLFPNSSGKVDSRFLFLLEDISKVSEFAWGAAVLEDLFYWLNRRKEINVRYVGGCLILLQIWLYEHVDIARPSCLNCYPKFPRVCNWGNSRSHSRQWHSPKFKALKSNQIIWKLELTSEESGIEIIREFLATECERMENQVDQRYLPDVSLHRGGFVLISSDNSEQGDIFGSESDLRIVQELLETPESIPNQLSICSTDRADSPSSSCIVLNEQNNNIDNQPRIQEILIVVSDSEEDEVDLRKRALEKQNVELKKEINGLKKEIEFLNEKLLSSSMITDQNIKLKREVENLTQENQNLILSTNKLVARLEYLSSVWQ